MTKLTLPPVRPDPEILLSAALATGGESSRFDFKEKLDLSSQEHKVRLVKAVGAFANTDEGGFVFVGISDKRKIVGLNEKLAAKFDQTAVQNILRSFLAPPPTIQVRHHEHQKKQIVIIEVEPFAEIPCIVKQGATQGSERLFAGTFLHRNDAAQSTVLAAEKDIRALCDAIVRRRATSFLELVQKGSIGRGTLSKTEDFRALRILRERADLEWPSVEGSRPYLEVAFGLEPMLKLSPQQMRAVIPGACIPIRHGFPFFDMGGPEVYRSVPWGWYGRIPFSELGQGNDEPSFLWMLSREGAFLDRERFWEDEPRSVIPGGVGLFHVMGKIILLLRFAEKVLKVWNVNPQAGLRLSVLLNNVKDRYLGDEKQSVFLRGVRYISQQEVQAEVDIPVDDLWPARHEIAVNLVEDVAWQFGRDDMTRQFLEGTLRRARDHLGSEYSLD